MAEKETLTTKFAKLEAELQSEHYERDEEIRCAILALISGTTFFMLGEPGIAKSMLVRRLHLRIDGAQFFDHDLDKFTTPDDLFGPRSLAAMKDDRWERQTAGTIVEADYAFLDEFFEASSALLKALLRTLNERTFHQGTEIIPMRLTTLYAASNEVPSDPRMAALYDRLLIRRKLSRIQDFGSFVSMLELQLDRKPEVVLDWSDVLLAQAEAQRVTLSDRLLMACGQIRTALGNADIRPSDRRFAEAMKVVRAAAWLDDCAAADPEHLRVLGDILWAHPDQIPEVVQVIDSILEPLVSEADELLRKVEGIRRQIRTNLSETEQRQLASELHDKLRLAERDLKSLRERSKGGSTRQQRQIERCQKAVRETGRAIMRDLFEIDVEALEGRASGS